MNSQLLHNICQVLSKQTSRFLLALAVVLLSVATVALECRAEDFEEAQLFIECDAMDGEAIIRGFIDADEDSFQSLRLLNSDGDKLLEISVKRELKKVGGLANLAFTSSERTLNKLLDKFPAGTYTFVGKEADGGETLLATVELTHDLPDPPIGLEIAVLSGVVTILWTPPGGITSQQVIVTNADGRQMIIDLPDSGVGTLEIPPSFLFPPPLTIEVEVVAIAGDGGNRTSSEGICPTIGGVCTPSSPSPNKCSLSP